MSGFLASVVCMPQNIVIAGARENNLRDVSLTIPKNQITVFTGVSGSGKSSIVFDTVAVESQRQLNETFTWFIRNRLPKYERPHVDTIDDLSVAIVVDQKPVGGNVRSTVGSRSPVDWFPVAGPNCTTSRVSTYGSRPGCSRR